MAEGGRAHTGALGLSPVLGEHVQQELRNANEVDNLCDAKERSNDQGSAVRPFQEGHGPFLLPDLPGERWHRHISVHPTPPPHQESLGPSPAFLPPSRDCCHLAPPRQQIIHPSPMCSVNGHGETCPIPTSGQEQEHLPGSGCTAKTTPCLHPRGPPVQKLGPTPPSVGGVWPQTQPAGERLWLQQQYRSRALVF